MAFKTLGNSHIQIGNPDLFYLITVDTGLFAMTILDSRTTENDVTELLVYIGTDVNLDKDKDNMLVDLLSETKEFIEDPNMIEACWKYTGSRDFTDGTPLQIVQMTWDNTFISEDDESKTEATIVTQWTLEDYQAQI